MPASSELGPAAVVPAVGAPSSTSVLRSLGQRGVRTIAVSDHDRPPAFASRFCDERIRVPSPDDDLEAYRDALLDVASREAVRAVVPMREADVYVLAKHRSAFAEHVTPFWPTMDGLTAAQDRAQLFSIAGDLDVPMPETTLLGEAAEDGTERIVKSRYALLTADQVETVETPGCVSLPKTLFLDGTDSLNRGEIRDAFGHEPIVQEYVSGTEYTFRGVFDHGEPVATTLKELVRGIKYPRGPSICHRAAEDAELEAYGRRLLEHLEWHGLASVGFIKDERTGEPKLMEINPRFWASLPMDIHAGVDHPYYYWRLATGGDGDVDPSYEVGTTSHLLRGELVHLHSVLFEEYPLVEKPSATATASAIGRSLRDHPNWDLLRADDPQPFVRDSLNTARSTIERLVPG